MIYDFTTFLNRTGHDALAYDGLGLEGFPKKGKVEFSPISMWVADMNFVAFPDIIEGIEKRLSHPSFGYFLLPSEYYQRIAWWHYTKYNVKGLKQEHIVYANSVLGGLVATLDSLIAKGDAVLTHEPTYIGFLHAVKDAGYRIVTSPLKLEDGIYQLDLADMENKIVTENIKVMILCNPHNPSGKAWTKDELKQIATLCKKYEVIIISDEIWADLDLNNDNHIPMQSVSSDAKQRTIALYGLTKTFNLASITGAYMVIYNVALRNLIKEKLDATCLNNPHILSVHALINAYTDAGMAWVKELNSVLADNVKLMTEFLKQYPSLKFAIPQATYMFYVDASQYCNKHKISFDDLLNKGYEVGVVWQDGRPFGVNETIRINVASPTKVLIEALERLKKGVLVQDA